MRATKNNGTNSFCKVFFFLFKRCGMPVLLRNGVKVKIFLKLVKSTMTYVHASKFNNLWRGLAMNC